jgi:hypothetical protein
LKPGIQEPFRESQAVRGAAGKGKPETNGPILRRCEPRCWPHYRRSHDDPSENLNLFRSKEHGEVHLNKRPHLAPRFYIVLAASMLIGLTLCYMGINAVAMRFWSPSSTGYHCELVVDQFGILQACSKLP